MNADDDRNAELLRRFEAVIGGAELDDLRQLAADLSVLGAHAGRTPARTSRPELRRKPPTTPRTFQIRADLAGATPPIWRRVEVRSDLRLDEFHRVLQAAFDWTDTHLWRFSLGGDPFNRASQLFLCQWDVEEGDVGDAGGIPASEVRLAETMLDPGDVLYYAYDYGDGWELTLRLEESRPLAPDGAAAVVIDGRRGAPPEDCGGRLDADSLAEVLEDPASFDLAAINQALESPSMLLIGHGFDRRLTDLVYRLTYNPNVGEDLSARALALIADPGPPDNQELSTSLRSFAWFLDRAGDDGLALTAAGYLKPDDVYAAAQVVPTMAGWIGKANRENDARPILHFRKALQSIGLLRKHKGTLRLTRSGAAAREAREELWNHLADKLAPAKGGFDTDATLLLLLYAATSADAEIPMDQVANALTELGWRTGDGQPAAARDLYWLPALEILRNVTAGPVDWRDRWRISPAAARLARAALRRH
jgi:hypothetical protein